jgi:molybdate transport repressor ModE-like protein
MKIEIRPGLFLVDEQLRSHSLVRGLQLLAAIEKAGNLQGASKILAISYRHAWNTLTEMEALLGGSAVEMTRGRGSVLTPLGKRLVGAERLVHARIAPLLDSMASEIEAEIGSTLSHLRNVLKIYASHGFAIEMMTKRLQQRGFPLDFSYRGSMEALNALSRGSCEVAGIHVPIGPLEQPVFAQFERLLRPEHRLVSLANRRQGIMVPKGNPKKIWSIGDLMRNDVQFVNRQQGSGTRMILDLLLAQEDRAGSEISGYENVELTHAAVAAYILCAKADAGLGVETAARQFGLDFIPILSERYLLVCDKKLLDDARFTPLLELLRASEFKSEVNELPGYDAVDTGNVFQAQDLFKSAAKRKPAVVAVAKKTKVKGK